MEMRIIPSGASLGARVEGLDLSQPLGNWNGSKTVCLTC